MGVTYYKLEQRYEGDVTKGCGLTSAEVDANFHFLRGYDIKNVSFDNGILTFDKVSGDKIVVSGLEDYVLQLIDDAGAEVDLSGTTFDPETGILKIVVNGNPFEVSGFISDDTFKIYVGYGLDGQGTIADPVRISHIMDTGFYAPVERVIDFEQGETLPNPSEGGDVAKRYLTREGKSPYGLLYGFSAVQKIDAYLKSENHGWRVPTFDDWTELLNAQECEDEFRNHGNKNESSKNGKIAGAKLKDFSWHEEESGTGLFNVLPIYTKNYPIDGDRLTAEFWASTVSSADTHVYGKRFEGGESTVETLGNEVTSNWLSLRLVRDIEWGNESGIEVIGGVPYETVVMPTYKVNSDGDVVSGTAIWTKENVSFNEYLETHEARFPAGPSYIMPDDEAFEESVKWYYYVNYYDGFDEKWVKKQLHENDVVMVHDLGDAFDEEVIVRIDRSGNPTLVRRQDELFGKILDKVDEKVQEEADARIEADNFINATISALTDGINEEIEGLKDADRELQESISGLSDSFSDLETRLVDRLAQEENTRAEQDEILGNKISDVESGLESEAQTRNNNDVNYNTDTVDLGWDGDGLSIMSRDGESRLRRPFSLDMGAIELVELNNNGGGWVITGGTGNEG